MRNREISVDVLVAGGGAAGIAAAVTAARAGAETLLVDRQCMLGGMGSAALVHTICGLYLLRREPGAEYAHDGFPKEFAERLLAIGGALPPVRMGRLDVLPHHPVAFAQLADTLVQESGNLKVWLHSELAEAHGHGRRLSAIEILCCGERRRVRAAQFIDASGDANVLALAGAATEQTPAESLQRPAYVVGLQGLEPGALADDARLRLAHAIARGVKARALPAAAMGAGFRNAIHPGEAYLTIDLAGAGKAEAYDPTDPACLTAVTAVGRSTAGKLIAYLRTRAEGFSGAWISHWPARPGIRESRRATGTYRLTGADLLRSATFPDAVALATWPLELRESPTGARWRFPESGLPGQIPLQALQSADFDNVLAAGRCLSCDHDAQASIRVMGTCMATGEAAARAATASAPATRAPSPTPTPVS